MNSRGASIGASIHLIKRGASIGLQHIVGHRNFKVMHKTMVDLKCCQRIECKVLAQAAHSALDIGANSRVTREVRPLPYIRPPTKPTIAVTGRNAAKRRFVGELAAGVVILSVL